MKRTAFTLLELLIVLAILIVLIGIVGTTVWSAYEKALVRSTQFQIKTFGDSLETFRLDHKRYPTMIEGLDILAGQTNPDAPQVAQNAGMGNDPTGMGVGLQSNGMQQGMGGFDQTTMGMQPNSMQQGMGGFDQTTMGMPGTMQTGNLQTPPGGMGMQQGMPGTDPTGMGMGMQGNPGMGNTGNVQQPASIKIMGKYLDNKELPKDPWQNRYHYEWPTTKGDGKKPAIWSDGPDKKDENGGGDDIISWDPNDLSGQMQVNQSTQQGMGQGFDQTGLMGGSMGGFDQTGGMMGGMNQGMSNGMTGNTAAMPPMGNPMNNMGANPPIGNNPMGNNAMPPMGNPINPQGANSPMGNNAPIGNNNTMPPMGNPINPQGANPPTGNTGTANPRGN